jgi:hypothetical protein
MAVFSSEQEAIASVVTHLVHHVDHKEWVELQGLFSDRVETDYRSLFGGDVSDQTRGALVDGWRGMLQPIATQHLLGPLVVHHEDSRAVARCHVRAWHHRPGSDGGEWMIAGHYVFRLAKEQSGWKIAAMRLELFYETGDRGVLQA